MVDNWYYEKLNGNAGRFATLRPVPSQVSRFLYCILMRFAGNSNHDDVADRERIQYDISSMGNFYRSGLLCPG